DAGAPPRAVSNGVPKAGGYWPSGRLAREVGGHLVLAPLAQGHVGTFCGGEEALARPNTRRIRIKGGLSSPSASSGRQADAVAARRGRIDPASAAGTSLK